MDGQIDAGLMERWAGTLARLEGKTDSTLEGVNKVEKKLEEFGTQLTDARIAIVRIEAENRDQNRRLGQIEEDKEKSAVAAEAERRQLKVGIALAFLATFGNVGIQVFLRLTGS